MFRPRRLRRNEMIRSMVRENHLNVTDFISPLFVEEGENIKKEKKDSILTNVFKEIIANDLKKNRV